MIETKLKSFEEVQGDRVFRYETNAVQTVAEQIQKFFEGRGYKLEKGTIESGSYGIGNATMRILFGAFVKRFLFNFEVIKDEMEANTVKFVLTKDSLNKISGGLIGYNQLKKEIQKIVDALTNA